MGRCWQKSKGGEKKSMKDGNVHSPTSPEVMQYNMLPNGAAEVWIRKNITQASAPSDVGEGMEYVYEEVYFQTTATKEQIEENLGAYWTIGESWEPERPKTQEEKIRELEEKLQESRNENDLAIAELTMLMAAMMGGEESF